MSFEAIEQITQVESRTQERKAAAQAQAKEITAAAESVEHGKELLHQAEARAAEQTAQIRKDAEAEADQLRQAAQLRLEKAADFIVEGVVKH